MKQCSCSSCKEHNPQSIGNFYKDRKSKDGLSNRCKACIKLVKSRHYSANKEKENQKCREWKRKNPEKMHAANIRNSYGIDADKYKSMLEEQHSSCAICGLHNSLNTKSKNNKPRNLAVDHSHVTGKIRGLLCYSCNLALGMLKDSINNAKSLIMYLEKHEEKK